MKEKKPRSLEATNWLTVFPTNNRDERRFLLEMSRGLGDFPDTKRVVLALSQAIDTGEWEGNRLSKSRRELLRRVFEFVCEGVAVGLDEVVNIANRRVAEAEDQRGIREDDGELRRWSFYSGDYRGMLVGAESGANRWEGMGTGRSEELYASEYRPSEERGDVVNFMRKYLKARLEQERKEPVILVDVGSMYGYSLLELAGVFRQEIEQGKLVLIGTNVGMTREMMEEMPKPTNGTGLTQDYEKMYKSNGRSISLKYPAVHRIWTCNNKQRSY